MNPLARNILEFLESAELDAEGVNLEEAATNAAAKFGARVKANKRVGKRLTPSKYLKKYGSSWQNLKNETELEGEPLEEIRKETLQAYKEKATGDIARVKEMRGRYLRAARKSSPALADDLTKMSKFLKARSQKRMVGIATATAKSNVNEEVVAEGKGMTPEKAKKEERLAKNVTMKNRFRDLLSKKEMRTSSSGVSHDASGKRMSEEVIPAKGNKKDKRASIEPKEMPTTPSGMNAGMRMMPEETLREEILAEISKDAMIGAYRERLKLTAAHHTVGNKKEAKRSANKALSHADAIANYDANRAKYAKHAVARSIIAKRTKKATDTQVQEEISAECGGDGADD